MASDKKHTYTVVGIYVESGERFADFYEAHTAEFAQDMALSDHPDLTIAGVIEGKVIVAA